MRYSGSATSFAGIVFILSAGLLISTLLSIEAFCAAPQTPVEITGVKLSWVGPESSISPKEKGERSFWKGGRPPTSSDYSARDRVQEGAFSGNWGKMDVEFTTFRDWEDEIEFRFYLLLKDRDGFKMLAGRTTVMYVAKGRKHYVVMYAYPNAIGRYGGNVQAMAVEAIVNGKVVASKGEPKVKETWWRDYSPIGGAIIDWFYTPMKRTGVQEYELIKISK